MKKRICAALAMLLLLTACGSPGAESTPTPSAVETPEVTASVPTGTPIPEPTETLASGVPVYTDWSKLEPYESRKAVYTRRYEGFTDTLIPAEDYGLLLSFAGAEMVGWGQVAEDEIYKGTSYLYGLVTQKGEVVVDPVLSTVAYLTERDEWGNQSGPAHVMVIGKVFYDGEGQPEERFAFCAVDGSWCTDFVYDYSWEDYISTDFTQGVPAAKLDGPLVFLDPDTGAELRALDLAGQAGTDKFFTTGFTVDPATGWTSIKLYLWEGDTTRVLPLLFDPQGKAHALPAGVEWVGRYGDGLVPADGYFEETERSITQRRSGYVNAQTGEWVIPPIYTDTGDFQDGVAWVCKDSRYDLIDTHGTVLAGGYTVAPTRHGDYWYVTEDYSRIREVLDKDLNPVDSPLVGTSSCSFLEDGWVCGKGEGEWIWARGNESHRFSTRLLDFGDFQSGRVLFRENRGWNVPDPVTLTDLEGNVVARWVYSGYFSRDQVTGETYVNIYVYEGEDYHYQEEQYYDLDGNLLTTTEEYGYLEGGLLCHMEDDCTTLTDFDGNVVFCWPFFSVED